MANPNEGSLGNQIDGHIEDILRAGKYAVVDLDVLGNNIAIVRKTLPRGVRLMVVVKGNAYGHGRIMAAHCARRHGADMLGTNSVLEGRELRRSGIDLPILVFDPPREEDYGSFGRYHLSATVENERQARGISSAAATAKPIPVHVKIDMGLGRFGARPAEAYALLAAIESLPGLALEGVYTHFARRMRKVDLRESFERFDLLIGNLRRSGFDIPMAHCAESRIWSEFPEMSSDMVRIGNAIYGTLNGRHPDLGDPFSAYCRINRVRKFEAGSKIGYGAKWTGRDILIGIVPAGQADGLVGERIPATVSPLWFLRKAAKHFLSSFALSRNLEIPSARPEFIGDGKRLTCVEISMNHSLIEVDEGTEAGDWVEIRTSRLDLSFPILYRRDGDFVAYSRRVENFGVGIDETVGCEEEDSQVGGRD
ncbi:MAG: alanine racemase [Bacillota bacterium]